MPANLFELALMEIYLRWTRNASLMVIVCQNPFQCNLDLMNVLLNFGSYITHAHCLYQHLLYDVKGMGLQKNGCSSIIIIL